MFKKLNNNKNLNFTDLLKRKIRNINSCVCDKLEPSTQEIFISNDNRKWGKTVTLIKFSNKNEKLSSILKEIKTRLGVGGTIRDNLIEVRGEQRLRVKKLLLELGFNKDAIFFRRSPHSEL